MSCPVPGRMPAHGETNVPIECSQHGAISHNTAKHSMLCEHTFCYGKGVKLIAHFTHPFFFKRPCLPICVCDSCVI